MKFRATAGSLVDYEIFKFDFEAKNEKEAWEKAMDHFKYCDYVDHGTIDVEKRKPLKKTERRTKK